MAMASSSKSDARCDSSDSSDGSSSRSSWVDFSSIPSTPKGYNTPPLPIVTYKFDVEEAMRVLRKAQREPSRYSTQSSRTNSSRTSKGSSPKSPPNSPRLSPSTSKLRLKTPDLISSSTSGNSTPKSLFFLGSKTMKSFIDSEWAHLYVNQESAEPSISDEWSSRPGQHPPKIWKFRSRNPEVVSIRSDDEDDNKFFSRKGVYVLVVTNLLSLFLGGLGVMLIRMHNFQPLLQFRTPN